MQSNQIIFSSSMSTANTPPQTQQELLQRCHALAGKTLGQVAAELGEGVPEDLSRYKGWVGELLERYLGADAGNKAEPDFVGLGIEMKTLPLNSHGQPKESTYVCTVSSQHTGPLTWEQSWVRRKLAHVLWLPIEADNSIPLAQRFVGQAWLWQPTAEQLQILQQDWEELMDQLLAGGQVDITAAQGVYLQLRPKAATSRVLKRTVTADGELEMNNPRGFYLRTQFTAQILLQSQLQ
jgi:DNA mismatch repair protein MutH